MKRRAAELYDPGQPTPPYLRGTPRWGTHKPETFMGEDRL